MFRDGAVIENPVDLAESTTKRYADKALRFIREKKTQPFFIYLCPNMPHTAVHTAQIRGQSPRSLYGDVVEELDHRVGRILDTLPGERADRVPNFEILIEDQQVEKLLGRKAGDALGVGGDPAKGGAAGEGERPIYPTDYIGLCRRIGPDAIVLGEFWTPIKQRTPRGSGHALERPEFQEPRDLKRVIWPRGRRSRKALGYVREYVAAGPARTSRSCSPAPASGRPSTSSLSGWRRLASVWHPPGLPAGPGLPGHA